MKNKCRNGPCRGFLKKKIRRSVDLAIARAWKKSANNASRSVPESDAKQLPENLKFMPQSVSFFND
jgi:hypothetical protein